MKNMTKDNLGEKIKSLERAIDIKLDKKKKEETEREIRNREYVQFEKMHGDEKHEIYHYINEWAEIFSKSAIFQKILELDPFHKDHIKIYGGEWGHKLPQYGGYGCWSFVTLNENSSLEYNAGYKWMGVSERFPLDEENIDRLNLQYIKDINDSIKSEKVYEYIKKSKNL